MLQNAIDSCMAELSRAFKWFYDIPEVAQIVLIDMRFNLGLPRLLTFKKTLYFIQKNEWAKASVEMLDSKWAGQVGRRAMTLSDQLSTLA